MSGKDFFQLVSTCDLKKVQKFLQARPGDDVINYQNNNGNTPLIQACNVNSPENSQKLVKALLDVGVDVERMNQNGDRALLLASKRGYTPVVEMLLAAHCEFDFANQLGQRPLDVAGNDATRLILQKLQDKKTAHERALYVEELSHRLLDLLFESAPKSKPGPSRLSGDIIEHLKKYASEYPEILEYESLEIRHKRKRPLAACVMAQNYEVLEFLLENYPAIRVDGIHSNCAGRYTPLMLNSMIPLWSTYPQSPDARIAEERRFSITQTLLRHLSCITHKDIDGITALMRAVQCNHTNDIEAFFQRFPSAFENTLEAQDKHGITALSYATKRKFYPVVLQLLARKPQLNHHDENGMTALMWSAYGGDVNSATVLLEAGALPNLRSECGRTALLWAIERNHPLVVDVLLLKGADPNISLPSSGSSALLIAARLNSFQSMSSLITAGARLNEVNADGLSPLMWAAWNNQEQSVEILLKNGASATLKDRSGKCALAYSKSEAIQSKIQEEMVKISVEKKFGK